jgi:siroheme synthase-like protein
VAARKVEGLLAAEAAVTVVAPEAVETIEASAARGELAWKCKRFEAPDLDGMVLVFAATSDRRVNRQAAGEARARGIWANVADDPEACNFFVPATVRRGGACVAVSTGGASPALAAWLRDRAAEALPQAVGALVAVARGLRSWDRRAHPGAFRELFDSGLLADLEAEDWDAANGKVVRLFGGAPGIRELLGREGPASHLRVGPKTEET